MALRLIKLQQLLRGGSGMAACLALAAAKQRRQRSGSDEAAWLSQHAMAAAASAIWPGEGGGGV
jgi:hypothetical protein